MRTPLPNNSYLVLFEVNTQNTSCFEIIEIIDGGGSSLVYRGRAMDSGTLVIIKEAYHEFAPKRNDDDTVPATDAQLARFRQAFARHVKTRNDEITMNQGVHAINLYTGYGTLYAISTIQNAKTLDQHEDSGLHDLLATMIAITDTVGRYHNKYLLLDIKPKNILLTVENRGITPKVAMFDFDSVVAKADIAAGWEMLSSTLVYAAPELRNGRCDKLCEATDIYSLGAILFERLTGRLPDVNDTVSCSAYNLETLPYFIGASNKEIREMGDLLRGMLSASTKTRIASTSEVIQRLKEIQAQCTPGFAESTPEGVMAWMNRHIGDFFDDHVFGDGVFRGGCPLRDEWLIMRIGSEDEKARILNCCDIHKDALIDEYRQRAIKHAKTIREIEKAVKPEALLQGYAETTEMPDAFKAWMPGSLRQETFDTITEMLDCFLYCYGLLRAEEDVRRIAKYLTQCHEISVTHGIKDPDDLWLNRYKERKFLWRIVCDFIPKAGNAV
jgi:hypothetical protein